ncbi:MAG: DUF3261 domain-containing protein [Myxococcota bacterium]
MRFVALICLLGCGPSIPAPTGEVEPYPTVLTAPAELDGDFAVQQDVTMRHARGENRFSAVLQKQGNVLTLVVLGPHGGRAFTLTQTGSDVQYEAHVDLELPFPPRYILHDIHRAWFPRLGIDDGETVTAQRDGERVRRVRFERPDKEGAIVVEYEGGLDSGAPLRTAPPAQATLHNAWFGYTATIRSTGWTAL